MSTSMPFMDFANTQSGSGGMLIPGIGSGSSAGVNMPGMPNSQAVNPFSMIPLTGSPGGGGSSTNNGDWLSQLLGMGKSFGGNTPGGLIPVSQTNPIGLDTSSTNVNPASDPSGVNGMKAALGKLFGGGFGDYLTTLLGSNYFNQIATADVNASLPTLARGTEGIMNEFGNMGERYSSAAAIGLGDYESQWALNQQQVIAQLLNQQIGRQFDLIGNLINPQQQQHAAGQFDWGGAITGALSGIASAFGL